MLLSSLSWGVQSHLDIFVADELHAGVVAKEPQKPVVAAASVPPRARGRKKRGTGEREQGPMKRDKKRVVDVLDRLQSFRAAHKAWFAVDRSSGDRDDPDAPTPVENRSLDAPDNGDSRVMRIEALTEWLAPVSPTSFVSYNAYGFLRRGNVPAAIRPEQGGNVPASRAARKAQQLASMLEECLERDRCKEFLGCLASDVVLQRASDVRREKKSFAIAELCAGSGHVGLPLLWALFLERERCFERERSCVGRGPQIHETCLHLLLLDMACAAMRTAEVRARALLSAMAEVLQGSGAVVEVAVKPVVGSASAEGAVSEKDRLCDEAHALNFLDSSTEKPLRSLQLLVDEKAVVEILLLCGMVSQFPRATEKAADNGILSGLGGEHLAKSLRPDLVIGLHACGRASDEILQLAARKNADFVVAPCCVGRLGQTVWDSSGSSAASRFTSDRWKTGNDAAVSYPRSGELGRLIGFADFCPLAKAADWAPEEEGAAVGAEEEDTAGNEGIARDRVHRAAKAVVDLDRALFVAENYPYKVSRVLMHPRGCTAKNTVLVSERRRA